MIGHRPISTSQHHPGAQRRQLRTGAIEAEQGQRGHGGRKPGKGMNLATSPQNECENRRRRPSRGLAHTPGTPIFALFRWTSERAASIRCPDGGSGQGSFASFLKGPLPPSGHRIERRTIDLQSDINCLPERSLLGAFGKQHDDYDHDVFNSAGSTLATPILVQRMGSTSAGDCRTVHRLPSSISRRFAERRPGSIGHITLRGKCAGARSAGKPHAACDVAGAGNGLTVRLVRHSHRKRGETDRPRLRSTAPALDPTGRQTRLSAAATSSRASAL